MTALARLLELTAVGSTGVAVDRHGGHSDPELRFCVSVWRRGPSGWIRESGIAATLQQAAEDCEVRARRAGLFDGAAL